MIVKFLPNKGGGTCKATMNYLLGRKGDREHAKVLQGDPKLTQQLADSLEFKHKYTVGVLSFEESDLDDRQKREIMADFEKALLCGLEQDQYNICWIEHRDKGRLELNFVIPKVELTTGKALNPYFDSVDRKRVNAFKDHINAKYDLSDPNDPANRQPYTPNMRLPKDKKSLQEAITGFLMQKIGEGSLTDREGVLRALQSDLGLSVARITPNSISIKDPTNENGRNIRLKGEIYADNFRFSQDYSAENERASREYRANRTERIAETGKILTAEIERKRAFNIELYNRPRKEPTREAKHRPSVQELANDNHRGVIGDSPSIGGNGNVFLQQYERQPSGTSSNSGDHRPNAPTAQSVEPIQHTTGRQVLLPSDQKQESGSIRQQKRRTHNKNQQVGQNYAQQLFERLQRIVERARTAVKRVTGDHSNTGRADTAINGSQSRLESTERAITGGNSQINSTEQQIKQREQQANELATEQQKALANSKGFGFGR